MQINEQKKITDSMLMPVADKKSNLLTFQSLKLTH
jgi:hypothetical protein